MADGNTSGVSGGDVKAALNDLYQKLNSAYWVATAIEDKDRLRGLCDVVSDQLDQIDVDEINSRSGQFQAVLGSLNDLNGRLDKLKTDIDGMIHNINVATSVVGSIDKFAGVLGQLAG
jgi:ABC-type transporter Mla subunit MlaD